MEKANLDKETFGTQMNQKGWPAMKEKLIVIFKTKTREEWCEIMEGTDVCFAPVLDFMEAQKHPHNVARKAYIDIDGMTQPAPAPKFSRTESKVQFGSRAAGEDTETVLKDWGIS